MAINANDIKKHAGIKQEHGEPVAWMRPDWPDGYSGFQSPVTTYMTNGWIPLYTHPQPAQKPLTDEQTRKVARLFSDRVARECNVDAEDHWKYHSEQVVDDVRFVLEAAHGIMSDTDGKEKNT